MINHGVLTRQQECCASYDNDDATTELYYSIDTATDARQIPFCCEFAVLRLLRGVAMDSMEVVVPLDGRQWRLLLMVRCRIATWPDQYVCGTFVVELFVLELRL